MRIITCNVNGLRAAHAKGFTPWMRRQKPDIVCLQEIKARESDLPQELLAPKGLHAFFHPAEKRGYSGVAMYSKREPDRVTIGLGLPEFDAQGRFLQLDFGDLSVVSLYMPSGTMGEEAQARKYEFMERFLPREREWLTCVLEEHGFVDVFRRIDSSPDRFTWWNQFGNTRARNVGWRIDYQIATPGIAKTAKKASIYMAEIFSDHAPVVIDYDYTL